MLVLLWQGVEGLYDDLQYIFAFEQSLEGRGVAGELRLLLCIGGMFVLLRCLLLSVGIDHQFFGHAH